MQSANRSISLPASEFDCLICRSLVKNPMSCMRCHKFLCEEHVAALRKCPFCNDTPLRMQEAVGVGVLLDALPFPCKYCKSAVPKVNLDVHEANCDKRPRVSVPVGSESESVEWADAVQQLFDSNGEGIQESDPEPISAGIMNALLLSEDVTQNFLI